MAIPQTPSAPLAPLAPAPIASLTRRRTLLLGCDMPHDYAPRIMPHGFSQGDSLDFIALWFFPFRSFGSCSCPCLFLFVFFQFFLLPSVTIFLIASSRNDHTRQPIKSCRSWDTQSRSEL